MKETTVIAKNKTKWSDIVAVADENNILNLVVEMGMVVRVRSFVLS